MSELDPPREIHAPTSEICKQSMTLAHFEVAATFDDRETPGGEAADRRRHCGPCTRGWRFQSVAVVQSLVDAGDFREQPLVPLELPGVLQSPPRCGIDSPREARWWSAVDAPREPDRVGFRLTRGGGARRAPCPRSDQSRTQEPDEGPYPGRWHGFAKTHRSYPQPSYGRRSPPSQGSPAVPSQSCKTFAETAEAPKARVLRAYRTGIRDALHHRALLQRAHFHCGARGPTGVLGGTRSGRKENRGCAR